MNQCSSDVTHRASSFTKFAIRFLSSTHRSLSEALLTDIPVAYKLSLSTSIQLRAEVKNWDWMGHTTETELLLLSVSWGNREDWTGLSVAEFGCADPSFWAVAAVVFLFFKDFFVCAFGLKFPAAAAAVVLPKKFTRNSNMLECTQASLEYIMKPPSFLFIMLQTCTSRGRYLYVATFTRKKWFWIQIKKLHKL